MMTKVAHARVFLSAALIVALMSGAAAAKELAGAGKWESVNGDSMRGTWSFRLNQTGNDVRGSLTLDGSNFLSNAEVVGTVSEDRIAIGTVNDSRQRITFTGKLSESSVEGEWSFDPIGDNGVWWGSLSEETRAE